MGPDSATGDVGVERAVGEEQALGRVGRGVEDLDRWRRVVAGREAAAEQLAALGREVELALRAEGHRRPGTLGGGGG
ncbi:MAG: hypothetical protein ACE5EF_14220, partial [Dehalococcoidia bacterium]